MPRTRAEVDRDEKVAEIVSTAERRLREGGYGALSVADIARELQLAQNAIYWYFPSKNHLFVAALQRLFQDIAARKAADEMTLDERILWFADELAVLYGLRGAIYEQARRSEIVAGFSEQLDALVGRMFTNALQGRVAEEDLPLAAETLRATIVGTYAERTTPAARRQLLTFVLERLTH